MTDFSMVESCCCGFIVSVAALLSASVGVVSYILLPRSTTCRAGGGEGTPSAASLRLLFLGHGGGGCSAIHGDVSRRTGACVNVRRRCGVYLGLPAWQLTKSSCRSGALCCAARERDSRGHDVAASTSVNQSAKYAEEVKGKLAKRSTQTMCSVKQRQVQVVHTTGEEVVVGGYATYGTNRLYAVSIPA